MAPHNASYPELPNRLREGDIGFVAPNSMVNQQSQDEFELNLHNFANPIQIATPS